MEENNKIIKYEEEFPKNTLNVKLRTNKLPYLISLLLYGALMLFSIVGNINAPKVHEDLFTVLELDEQSLVILTADEYLDVTNNPFETKPVVYLNETYYLISTNEVELIEIEALFNKEIQVLWPGTENLVKVVYNSSQSFNELTVDNDNFINITNYYNSRAMALSNFITYILISIPLVLLMFVDLKNDTVVFFKDKKYKGLNKFFDSILPMFLISIFSGLLATGLSLLIGSSTTSENQAGIEQAFQGGAFFMFITVVILAPLVEELVYRKAIFSVFKNKKVAFNISLLTFAFIHLISELIALIVGGFTLMGLVNVLVLAIPYVAMGAFLTYIYKKNDENVVLVILLHAFSNFISAIGLIL